MRLTVLPTTNQTRFEFVLSKADDACRFLTVPGETVVRSCLWIAGDTNAHILVEFRNVLAHLAKNKVATVLGPVRLPPLFVVIVEPRIIDQDDPDELSICGSVAW